MFVSAYQLAYRKTMKDYIKINNTGYNVNELPDNLQVSGNLDLRETAITSLPDNLQVGGNLYLNDTIDITELSWLILKGINIISV